MIDLLSRPFKIVVGYNLIGAIHGATQDFINDIVLTMKLDHTLASLAPLIVQSSNGDLDAIKQVLADHTRRVISDFIDLWYDDDKEIEFNGEYPTFEFASDDLDGNTLRPYFDSIVTVEIDDDESYSILDVEDPSNNLIERINIVLDNSGDIENGSIIIIVMVDLIETAYPVMTISI